MATKKIEPCRTPWRGTMTARERFNRQMHLYYLDLKERMFGLKQDVH